MKLSRALLIVLVLHVVAVAGIIAFNAIKTPTGSPVADSPAQSTAARGDARRSGRAVASRDDDRCQLRSDTTAPAPPNRRRRRKATIPKAIAGRE